MSIHQDDPAPAGHEDWADIVDDDQVEFERELAAHRHFQATADWFTACQKLGLDHDRITLDQITRATLARDVRTQVNRLNGLFEACGLKGPYWEDERTDLVAQIAEEAPQNERERTLIYHSAIARRLAFQCAEVAAAPDSTPQARALLAGSFLKLSAADLAIGEKLDNGRLRGARRKSELIGHLHVIQTATPLAPDRLFIDANRSHEFCEPVSKIGAPSDGIGALPLDQSGAAITREAPDE